MSATAYTIGRTTSYERGLAEATERPMQKIGRDNDDGTPCLVKGEPYSGGIVFRSVDDARAYLDDPSWRERFPDDDPGSYSVYELRLPTGWDADVYWNALGYHCLQRHAVIVGRACP